MPSLFGLNIAREVNAALRSAGGVLDATLIKVTAGTRTAGNLANGTNPTETSYACKGFMETATNVSLGTFGEATAGDLNVQERQTVSLLGDSIEGGTIAPVAGDRVTIEGATYSIQAVTRDPAGAVYECAVAGA